MDRIEVLIKIGGDHGGGNFRMTLQIINYSSVNSGVNTPVVLMFNAKDYYENIKTDVQKAWNEDDILTLAQGTHEWSGKKIKLFLTGDLAFLLSMYGLSFFFTFGVFLAFS